MSVQVHPPLALYESGQRQYNEDYLYPPLAKIEPDGQPKLFIVCDGVGGAVRGEEASRLVAETMGQCLENRPSIEDTDILQALRLAEAALDEFVQDNEDAEGMATTLAALFLHESGAIAIHVGDSRVYQIRKGEIKFRTRDHSLVNELIESKTITEEEARYHPSRNVVSRAVMSSKKPARADIAHLEDVQADDYFLLCSDGVLESCSDGQLAEWMSLKTLSNTEIMELIKQACQQHSRDNYSAWLIQIQRGTKAERPPSNSEQEQSNGLWEQMNTAFSKIITPKTNNRNR
ncbi:PP2C family protein-serine/threonine phosphatase [Phaeodactylibacter xiamenensis]|uniref:PP2C family protein-serine/threonine phosphatase n=1 Tax=Phaeodactylibacter xiamenensis TaxID=1524460 RepID=UPI0024A97423|nr:protein phosphatase 2C domain-containing protein [Phaeodactylibacter xiamenensis]